MAYAAHGRVGGADQVFAKILFEVVRKELCRRLHDFFIPVPEGDHDDPRIRRVEELLPRRYLVLEKDLVIVGLQIRQYRVSCIGYLYQHPTLSIFTAGAPAHLLHQLKGSFIDPKIGKAQDAVRIEDADEVDVFEVQSLDDHLRSHQDIDPLLFELLDHAVIGCLAPDAGDVHAGDTGFGKSLFQEFFDPLSPEIPLDETVIAAGGAGMQGRVYGTAIMAMQLIGRLMKVEGYIAVPALGDPSADLADLVRGITPTVLKENDLFAGGQ